MSDPAAPAPASAPAAPGADPRAARAGAQRRARLVCAGVLGVYLLFLVLILVAYVV